MPDSSDWLLQKYEGEKKKNTFYLKKFVSECTQAVVVWHGEFFILFQPLKGMHESLGILKELNNWPPTYLYILLS